MFIMLSKTQIKELARMQDFNARLLKYQNDPEYCGILKEVIESLMAINKKTSISFIEIGLDYGGITRKEAKNFRKRLAVTTDNIEVFLIKSEIEYLLEKHHAKTRMQAKTRNYQAGRLSMIANNTYNHASRLLLLARTAYAAGTLEQPIWNYIKRKANSIEGITKDLATIFTNEILSSLYEVSPELIDLTKREEFYKNRIAANFQNKPVI